MSERITEREYHPRWSIFNYDGSWQVERPGLTGRVAGEFLAYDTQQEALAVALAHLEEAK